MDEKTAELRDIFLDATGEDTVTESQEESPGSLTKDETETRRRVAELVSRMRDRYEFVSDVDDEGLERVVRGYFDGESDAELAEAIGVDETTVFDARMDLHLVRDADREAPFPLDELKRLHVEGIPVEEHASRLGTDEATVRHYSGVVEADLEATRSNNRFRDEFRELLTDADLEEPLASDAREDGLREAAEDIETDVSL